MIFVEVISVSPVPANAKVVFVSALLFFVFLSLFVPMVDSRMAVVKSGLFSMFFFFSVLLASFYLFSCLRFVSPCVVVQFR